jgi:hypothetical protein
MASPQWYPLLRQLIELCFLREQPQNLPASDSLVAATAIAAALTYALTNRIEGGGLGGIVLVAIAQVVLFGVVVWIALRMKSVAERWRQTITALYGTSAILQVIGWPIVSWFQNSATPTQPALLPSLAVLLLGVWYLLIMANVLRHAMELSTGASLLASFVCQMVTVMVLLPLVGTSA